MSDRLPGLHHCISTARSATEVVFRSLRNRCVANGGTLSLSLNELDAFRSQFFDSISSGYDLFEFRHRQCMNVSASLAEMPFGRDVILATLLRACGDRSALAAFSLQVERLGAEWIDQLFASLAEYMRQHVGADIDARLIKAYAKTAMIPKIKMTIVELLKQKPVQDIMLECVNVLDVPGAPDSITKEVCDWINKVVAGQRGIDRPHVSKITEPQTRSFLTLLPRQIKATIIEMSASDEATAPAGSAD